MDMLSGPTVRYNGQRPGRNDQLSPLRAVGGVRLQPTEPQQSSFLSYIDESQE
jgi:hypothetical protein